MSINIYIQLQSVQAQSFFFLGTATMVAVLKQVGTLFCDTLFLISLYSGGRIDFTAGSLLRSSKRIHCVTIIWLRVFLLWRCGSSATYLWLRSLFSPCFASLMWASLALAVLSASLSLQEKICKQCLVNDRRVCEAFVSLQSGLSTCCWEVWLSPSTVWLLITD